MYHVSRAIYRELAPLIAQGDPVGYCAAGSHAAVLRACEASIERLATDRHYFARPARTLFADVRCHFPVGAQARVWQIVERYVALADELLARQPAGRDASGRPLGCRATTRKGTQCQRAPLPHNGYCPSHQHLADTESGPSLAALAA